mmetsp:Transcript_1128/g.1844  ORF Transcript_1128/g.1844 Transcript_1128/m.1844 type:complete len:88 (+) Transcript_1128:467-730(+)
MDIISASLSNNAAKTKNAAARYPALEALLKCSIDLAVALTPLVRSSLRSATRTSIVLNLDEGPRRAQRKSFDAGNIVMREDSKVGTK